MWIESLAIKKYTCTQKVNYTLLIKKIKKLMKKDRVEIFKLIPY